MATNFSVTLAKSAYSSLFVALALGNGLQYRTSDFVIFNNFNIQHGGGRHLEKSPYLGRSLADFYKIWHGDAVRSS